MHWYVFLPPEKLANQIHLTLHSCICLHYKHELSPHMSLWFQCTLRAFHDTVSTSYLLFHLLWYKLWSMCLVSSLPPETTVHHTHHRCMWWAFHTSYYFSLKTVWLSVDRAHSLASNTAADVSFKPLLYWLPWWWVTAEKNRPTCCQCLILLLLNNVTYNVEKSCFHDNNNCEWFQIISRFRSTPRITHMQISTFRIFSCKLLLV